MISIYIHGDEHSGFLDLAPDSVLDMEELQPAFDEDLSLGEFSLPFDGILWTEHNRKLLLNAERFDNATPKNIFTCTVYDNGFPEIVKGKLTLLTKNGNLNFRTGRFSCSIAGSKGMYGTLIAKKKLTDLELGGKIEWAGMDSRQFAQDHMETLNPDHWYLSFAPVAIEDFIQQDRRDFDGEFLAKDCVNNVIVKADNSWIFGRPKTSDPLDEADPATEEYVDYRTVPFFRVIYVLRKCFEEFGYRIEGDFIDDSLFYKLVVYNNFSIEKYDLTAYLDYNRSITPSNHMPDILISAFLKALFGFFGIMPVFESDNAVRLVYRKNNLVTKTIANIEHIVSSLFESTYEDALATSGYKLSYGWDSNDGYYSDRVKDLSEKTLAASVNTYLELFTLDIGRSFTLDDIVYVKQENLYYTPADATVLPVVKWDCWGEGLHEYISGDGEEAKDYAISTLCQYAEFDSTEGLLLRKNYLGARQPGSYINNKGVLVKNPFGLRIFYSDMVAIGGHPRPMSYNHNIYHNAQTWATYSLAWNGAEGIAENFHTQWLDKLRNKELVKVKAAASQKDLQALRESNAIICNNSQFLLNKIERSIPLKGNSTIYLYPL